MKISAFLAAGLCVCAAAQAQYSSGFEGLTLGDLNGQDAWYLPAAGGVSCDVVDYTTNPWGIPANPAGGGANFAGGDVVQVGNIFGRSQRDFSWGNGTGVWIACYDFAWNYVGALPATNNLGSFSIQPYPGSAGGLNLVSYEDIATAAAAQHLYLYYDTANVAHAQPGKDPGALWNNLAPKAWYRQATIIDFDTKQVVCVNITDLATGATASFAPTSADPWLLQAGVAHPTGLRFFVGGVPGNVIAYDNLAVTCYADCEKDGDKDVFDFLCFQSAFASGLSYADCECDGDHDVFDFLCFQSRFAGCSL